MGVVEICKGEGWQERQGADEGDERAKAGREPVHLQLHLRVVSFSATT